MSGKKERKKEFIIDTKETYYVEYVNEGRFGVVPGFKITNRGCFYMSDPYATRGPRIYFDKKQIPVSDEELEKRGSLKITESGDQKKPLKIEIKGFGRPFDDHWILRPLTLEVFKEKICGGVAFGNKMSEKYKTTEELCNYYKTDFWKCDY